MANNEIECSPGEVCLSDSDSEFLIPTPWSDESKNEKRKKDKVIEVMKDKIPSEAVKHGMDDHVLDEIDGAKGQQVPNHVVNKDGEKSESTELKTSKVNPELKTNLPEQTVNHYVKSYVPPIHFPKRLEQHSNEALVHKTMENLKKINIIWPLLKEIRQIDNYPKYMKDLVANKPLTEEDDEVRMNPRCSALLQNLLDFNNALADLGASINIMPFSMFKCLGIGKLKPINMVIEMADDTKCIPKGIVKNLLITIDQFILLIDFVILDIIEDFRMPVILGRPLLATAHAKVDIFRNTISLEVGNEKVIFKMRSNFSNNIYEYFRMIKTEMNTEEDELMKINLSDLFTYNTDACKINHLLSIDPDVFTYDIEVQESYEEFFYSCSLIAQEENGGLRKSFGNEYDDNEDFEDPDGCGESKENKILGTIIDKLHYEWFKGTHEDDDNLEGIIDYLEPTLYDGFIDSDDEEYKERKYSIGPGELYTKIKVSEVEDLSRTRGNIATIRAGVMEEIFENDDEKRPHLDKECPLNKEVKQVEEVKNGEFRRPAPFNGSNGAKFHVGPPGYYTRIDNQTPSGEKRPNLVETINKYMEGATKRQA
ncbi:zinc knuckle CX2CX4HX4C containing protein [Tanacetum coccineum]|uniref:Zinc knuckle CX2CX4HX4C containing protein n=1 Tax=Tanacetum coccineum TaxID=301880 RepID=A0ABQ5BPL4_9ASTR